MSTFKKYSFIALFIAIAGYAIVAFAGAPLKGCDIKLGKNPGGSPAARTTTDDEGKFTFENLPAGKYDLYCSYDQCARAINTTGTGATVRTSLDAASKDAAKFEIELLPSDGVSFAMWPHMHQTATHAREGNPRDVVVTNGPMRVTLTKESDATTPLATITVSGGQRHLSGHAYAMYGVMK